MGAFPKAAKSSSYLVLFMTNYHLIQCREDRGAVRHSVAARKVLQYNHEVPVLPSIGNLAAYLCRKMKTTMTKKQRQELVRLEKQIVKWFSKSPFTAELAVHAHGNAFACYGGKPRHILYDQDAVFLHDENLGDYVLTKTFNTFVNQEHLDVIFCRKSDPESKGKVENAVKYIKYNFLRGRTFYDIARLNEEADHWLSRTANGLPHSATKLIPDEDFEEERVYLTPYTGIPSPPARQMMEYAVHKITSSVARGMITVCHSGPTKDKAQRYG